MIFAFIVCLFRSVAMWIQHGGVSVGVYPLSEEVIHQTHGC
mgnify:CR=1 FL=1